MSGDENALVDDLDETVTNHDVNGLPGKDRPYVVADLAALIDPTVDRKSVV